MVPASVPVHGAEPWPGADALQRPLVPRARFRARLRPGVLPSLRSGRMRELSSALRFPLLLRFGENQEFEQMPLRGTAQLAR